MRIYCKPLKKSLLSLPMLFLGQLAGAQPAAVPDNFSDHPLFDRFAYSEIIESEFEEDTNYRVVLGSLQRTRGVVSAEDSRLVRGDLTKIVYEVSQEFNGQDVYEFFREQMGEKGYTELFSCEGRGCGSSNYWANDIFRNRILYGPERNQFYLVMRANLGLEEDPYIAAYIITRGNRRIYAYLEIIEVGGSMAPVYHLDNSELLESLQRTGAVVVPGIGFTSSDGLTADTDLGFLADLLIANPELRIYLVSHLAGPGNLNTLQRRSRVRAENVRAALIELGVNSQQVDAEGVGPLAPFCDGFNCAERIELVLREALPSPEPGLPVNQ